MKRLPGALVGRYARSLFAAAIDLKALPQVRTDLEAVSATLQAYPELPLLFENPRLSREKVRNILDSLADRLQLGELTRRFIRLLVDKDRIEILIDIHAHFERLWHAYHDEIEVKVTTAMPVSDTLQREILDHLARRSGKTPLISWDMNPALLGGLVIAWPDHVFDGSLARKLENLKVHLAQGA